MHGPVGLALDAGDSLDSIEEVFALGGLLDVCVNEKGVSFRVDVLHHDLEAIEAASFGGLDLVGETFDEVLIDDAVGCGEEGKDVGDEVVFVVIELVCPVMEVLRKIHLFCSPERCFGLLVHLPYLSQSQRGLG